MAAEIIMVNRADTITLSMSGMGFEIIIDQMKSCLLRFALYNYFHYISMTQEIINSLFR